MKINKENFELILFDLLEGNLPEKDKAEVLEQIEGNKVWKKEWELLKMTVLEADEEIVFENKAVLLKKEGAAKVIAFFPKYSAWAAAASVIFAVWFFWPNSNQSDFENVANLNTSGFKGEQTDIIDKSPEDSIEAAVIAQDNVKTKKNEPQFNQHKSTPTPNPLPNEITKTSDNIAVKASKKVELENFYAIEIPSVTLLPSQRIIPVADAETTKETADSRVAFTEDAGLRKIVNRNISKALNPLKEPKLNFKTGVKNNNPTIMVSFSSRSYSADAQFLLKTNK